MVWVEDEGEEGEDEWLAEWDSSFFVLISIIYSLI